MRRLVFVTQLIDPDDPVLGYTADAARHLAERVDRVVVIANEVRAVPPGLDAEVISLGKERGWGRARRGARYQAVLARLFAPAGWSPRTRAGGTSAGGTRAGGTALLAHMCPTYLTQAAPVARLAGVPSLLWYSHPQDNGTLARAEWLAAAVLTALPGSYPRATPKLHVIGQTVNVATFALAPPTTGDGSLRLLAVGRLSPVKNLPVVVRAVGRARAAGVDVHLRIVGPVLAADAGHRDELGRLIADLGLGPYVTLDPPVGHDQVPAAIGQSTAVVCATAGGSADKTVFEAMACGRPVLASNPALATDLDVGDVGGIELRFPEGDDAALAARMADLAGAGVDRLAALGATLRARVETHHSLDHWASRVVEIAENLPQGRRASSRRTRPAADQPSAAEPDPDPADTGSA